MLAEHARTVELRAMAAGASKADRRELIAARLKQVAADTQGDLLALLALLARRGAVRVRPFWLHNVIGAEVEPSVVHELAAPPHVSYAPADFPATPPSGVEGRTSASRERTPRVSS